MCNPVFSDVIDHIVYVVFNVNNTFASGLYAPIFVICDNKQRADDIVQEFSGRLFLTIKEFHLNDFNSITPTNFSYF